MDGQLSLTQWIESLGFNRAQLLKNRPDSYCGLKILLRISYLLFIYSV